MSAAIFMQTVSEHGHALLKGSKDATSCLAGLLIQTPRVEATQATITLVFGLQCSVTQPLTAPVINVTE